MKIKAAVLNGMPDAGNPHVRFDEGKVASKKLRRGQVLCKFLNVLVLVVMAVAIGAGWMLTVKKLESLEQQICSIESRPLSLQDETKRRLEDLCKQVADNSAAGTHKVLEDRLAKSCEDLAAAMRGSQNDVGRLADAVSNEWNQTCGRMLSDGKEALRTAKDECAKTCEEVRDQSRKCILETEEMISKIADRAKAKSEAYLAAARKNTNDYQVCELLYRAAIMLSEDKQPLLSEYARWCQKSVKNLADEGRVDDADRQYTSLVAFFDSAIGTGSVSDICSIPGLTQQLAEVKALVDMARQHADREQLAAFERIEESARTATNYEQFVECRTKLDGVEMPEGLSDRKDHLDRFLTLKTSTVVPVSAPLIIPPIGEDTPWIAWLENFKARLASDDLTVETRAAEFAQAGEFVASAKEVDDEAVKSAAEETEKFGATICRNAWRKTVMAATGKADRSKDGVQQCVELLAASAEFSEEEQNLCRDELVALNRAVIVASLREIRQQADSAKRLQSKLSTDEYQQLLSMLQGQCLQMLIRLQELNLKFRGGFEKDIERVSVAVSGFSSVMSGFRKAREANDISTQRERDRRFLEWVKDRIDMAEYYYQKGEDKAKEWFSTTSNEIAQTHYCSAWVTIMEVNSAELGSLDEALFKLWNKKKEKIENRYTPSDEDLKNRSYRGRDSFR